MNITEQKFHEIFQEKANLYLEIDRKLFNNLKSVNQSIKY